MTDIHPSLEFLYGLTRLGIKASLDNISKLCSLLGNPQDAYRVIHIAGTNGKGTTAAILQSILSESGFKCGLYTSPHLVEFGERIRIDDHKLSDREAVDLIDELRPLFERVESTFFESATAMAFLHFARQKVDIAVIEVGLGGTWDATNIVRPMISVFTPISHDHTERLGYNLRSIASDKAGIIKKGAHVVSSLQEESALESIERRARDLECPFNYAPEEIEIVGGEAGFRGSVVEICCRRKPEISGSYRFSLPGKHHWENIRTALTAVIILQEAGLTIPDAIVKRVIEKVRWEGRLQIIRERPLVYFDAAHNPAAAAVAADFFREQFPGAKIRIVMGIVSDKDVNGVLRNIVPVASDFTCVELPTHRTLEPELLAIEASGMGRPARVIRDRWNALRTVIDESEPDDLILIIGSHYLGDLIR